MRIEASFRLRLPFANVFLERSDSLAGLWATEALAKGLLAFGADGLDEIIVAKGLVEIRMGGIPGMAFATLEVWNKRLRAEQFDLLIVSALLAVRILTDAYLAWVLLGGGGGRTLHSILENNIEKIKKEKLSFEVI